MPVGACRAVRGRGLAGIARQRLFQHGRGIGEYAETKLTEFRGRQVDKLLQALPQQLVVVAAQRIARNVADARIGKRALRVAEDLGKIVHTGAQYTDRSGHQRIGA